VVAGRGRHPPAKKVSKPPPIAQAGAAPGRCHGRGTPVHPVAACPRGLPVRGRGCGDTASFRRRILLRQRQPDAHLRQRRTGARRGAVPDRSGTRTPRRGRARAQREARPRRAGAQPRHGRTGLLLPHRPRRLHAARPDALRRLPPQLAGRVRGRREHRLGHDVAGHAAVDRGRLDGLARAPRQHPRRRLPRNRGRGRAAGPRRTRRRAARGAVHPGLRRDHPRRALLAPRRRFRPLCRWALDAQLDARTLPPLRTDNLRNP
jgi:hypothetical protein